MLRNFTAALLATALVAGPALAAQPSNGAGTSAPAVAAAPAVVGYVGGGLELALARSRETLQVGGVGASVVAAGHATFSVRQRGDACTYRGPAQSYGT